MFCCQLLLCGTACIVVLLDVGERTQHALVEAGGHDVFHGGAIVGHASGKVVGRHAGRGIVVKGACGIA